MEIGNRLHEGVMSSGLLNVYIRVINGTQYTFDVYTAKSDGSVWAIDVYANDEIVHSFTRGL